MHEDEKTAFIKSFTRPLAACAWDGFRRHGRGWVMVRSEAVTSPQPAEPTVFVTLKESRATREGDGAREAIPLCEDYDPETEFVVGFVGRSGCDFGIVHMNQRTPKQAYEAERASRDN